MTTQTMNSCLAFILFFNLIYCSEFQNQSVPAKIFFNIFKRTTTTPEPLTRTCDCACGEKTDVRIVGGENSVENEFPWMAQLTYLNTFYCGAALINDRYVITAAHCVKGFMWFLIKVRFGQLDRCEKQVPLTRYVLRATTGQFSFLNFKNDIALLRLNDRVPFSDGIKPICLPKNYKESYDGKEAIVSGWGAQKEDGTAACIMQKVNIPIISNIECKGSNYTEEMISEKMMCAGYNAGGKDSCKGDSGGPLVLQREDKKYEIIGIVSWGNGCARAGFPGVYTRLTHFIDWIDENTKDSCFCNN